MGRLRPSTYMGIEEVRDGRYWRATGGEVHRQSGPAIENVDGFKEWCIKGKSIAWQSGFGTSRGRGINNIQGFPWRHS